MNKILVLILWLSPVHSPGNTQTGEVNRPDQPDADGRILKPNTNSWAFDAKDWAHMFKENVFRFFESTTPGEQAL